jgi:hypothetical protein
MLVLPLAPAEQLNKEDRMKKKHAVLAAGVVSLGIAGLAGLSTASAAQNNGTDSPIDRLASRFNLNKDDVRAVVEEEREERRADRQAEISGYLQDKVDSGEITAEQKTAIEARLQELQSAREAEKESLQNWADEQGVDLRYVFGRGRDADKLDDAVADGDITAEQKTAIEAKQNELKQKREDTRQAIEQWADENGIAADFLQGMVGHHGKKHRGFDRN